MQPFLNHSTDSEEEAIAHKQQKMSTVENSALTIIQKKILATASQMLNETEQDIDDQSNHSNHSENVRTIFFFINMKFNLFFNLKFYCDASIGLTHNLNFVGFVE